MTEIDGSQDGLQKTPAQTEFVRLPLDYFILPLWLSFQTPLRIAGISVATLAAITDPIRPQWPGSNFDWFEFHWGDFAVLVLLSVGFVGMCCRREWALWLTVILQIICTLWIGIAVSMAGPDEFFLLWCVYFAYEGLIITACFYALWQCSQFQKKQRSQPSPCHSGGR